MIRNNCLVRDQICVLFGTTAENKAWRVKISDAKTRFDAINSWSRIASPDSRGIFSRVLVWKYNRDAVESFILFNFHLQSRRLKK